MDIKHVLENYIPICITNKIYSMYMYIVKYDECKHKKSYGNFNKKKVFYIIRPRKNSVEGLLALVQYVIAHIELISDKDYEIYIDFMNYKTQYNRDGINGENSWEYYFEQLSSYDVNEIYHSKNVILSGLLPFDNWKKSKYMSPECTDSNLKIWQNLVNRYIHPNRDVLKRVNSEKSLFDYDNCLGIYARGTDYVKLKPSFHPVQPSVEQIIEKADEFIRKYTITKVYIVTEDAEIYEKLSAKYAGLCHVVSFDKFITNYDGTQYLSESGQLQEDRFERGMEYLVKMILLSQCKYYVGGFTSGSKFSLAMNNGKYLDKYIFKLGMYK